MSRKPRAISWTRSYWRPTRGRVLLWIHFDMQDIEDGGINTGSAAGIRGVPTVIIYKKGVEVDRKVGGVPEGNMKEFLDKNI